MSTPKRGAGKYVGVVPEVTWGTAVSPRTAWNYVRSAGLRKAPAYEPFRHLTGAQGPLLSRKFASRTDAGGPLALYADYSSKVLGLLLKNSLGTVATTGSGPYTHTFTIADLPVGMTVEIGSLDYYEVFEGCKIASWRFSCGFGEAAVFDCTVIAETSAGLTMPNSSYPTVSDLTYPILHNHAGTCTINGNTYTLRRFEIRGDNKLSRRDQLGSLLTAEPIPEAHREFMATVELHMTDEVLEGDFNSGTENDATITFTDSPRSIAFTLHNCFIQSRGLADDGVGGAVLTLDLFGLNDGTDRGCKVVLINANSSAV